MLYASAAASVFAIGMVGAFGAEHPVRTILALNVASSGVFLALVALGGRGRAIQVVDPVPQALVLTGIVVSVSTTALALTLARRRSMKEPASAASADAPEDAASDVESGEEPPP
jgi:multicomponent Na+:H+ antiporter subunit C